MKKSLWIILALALIGVAVFGQTRSRGSTTVVWEYTTSDFRVEDLNKLGAEGWELVAVTSRGDNALSAGAAFLKRPKR